MKLLLIALAMLLTLLSAAVAEDAPIKWGQTDAVIPYTAPGKLPLREEMPDLMTFEDGTPVVTAEDWQKRRAEIKGLYEYYMYGYMPDGSEETLTWAVDGSTLNISIERAGKTVQLAVPFVLPQGEAPEGGWPFYIEYSWFGMSDVVKYAAQRGYAGFAYSPYAVASDNSMYQGAFYTLYPRGIHATNRTGALVAWSWGAAKILDALEQGAAETLHIDPALSILGGVSRFGKSVAVAGAYDERFKVVVPSCSGAGGLGMLRYTCEGKTFDLSSLGYQNAEGTGLWTNTVTEKWENIRGSGEQHWFCGNIQLVKDPAQMPFDQHFLAALCADPNRHYIVVTGILSEPWNNVEGQAMAYVGAQPAWDLLGASGNNNMIVHLDGHAILPSDMALILDYCDQAFFGIKPTLDLSVMKTNVLLEDVNASPLLKELMNK